MQDMWNKNRHPVRNQYGTNNSMAVLSDEDIVSIIALYNTGDYKQYEIADLFGVRQPYISRIVNGLRRLV
jgi:DNA-binding MarR family transcriptional regulator